MSANKFNGFTDLGIGVGLRVPHYSYILERKPKVGWFEIISENFMIPGGRPLEVLDEILQNYAVVQHGVAMYMGSSDPLNKQHLQDLKKLVARTKTPFLSDHLCWGSVNGKYSHDLLPLPYTKASAKHVAERIKYVQDFLETPVCVENISSYTEYTLSEMTEWQFLSEVTELADCGILLDVNNIYVASYNHGFDPLEYLNNVPHDRVAQIHLAGHTQCDGYILDTHDDHVKDEVWQLYKRAIELCGPTNTLLEWDGNFPKFQSLWAEAKKAEKFLKATNKKSKEINNSKDKKENNEKAVCHDTKDTVTA
ncbi:MAG TPA: DUF692 domain-containing protein [Oculatellaceae cyanobacterium]